MAVSDCAGATTMWERWNSYSREAGFGDAGMNSFNHYAYGAIGQWLYKSVAGIWRDESAPGYKNIIFNPKPGGGFTFASATHETPYGFAASSWKLSDGVMEWQITIPPKLDGHGGVPDDPRGIHPRKRLQSSRKGLRPQTPTGTLIHKQNALGRLPNPPPPVARRRGFGRLQYYGINMMRH